ncbi:uncharacterized protein LOC135813795 [Sycon ciliatum]|uniref:uncharacterized protein LOC135813795 n=1 Tax=Sycon ciliatum TaxID=27933 RepID=UPI0020AC915B|eukprot:scpid94598/ scgid26288/ rRNA-processing protein EFG1
MARAKKPPQGAKAKKKSVKVQIRGIERLLKKDDLPAPVRESQERMLAMLRGDQQDHQRQIVEQRMQKKYRMVRFFEKRKLMRKIQQCNKKLGSASKSDRRLLEERLADLHKDFNYIEYFPKAKKYISLFAEDQAEKSLQEKGRLREGIAKQVSAGALRNAANRLGGGDIDIGDDEES